LFEEYRMIRKRHGDKARNSEWITSNGYGAFYQRIRKYDLTWHQFLQKAGFDSTPISKAEVVDLEEVIEEYQNVRKKHGDKAKNCRWLIRKGYRRLYWRVSHKLGIPWEEFKHKAGFDDEPFDRRGMTQPDLIKEYKKVRKEVGNNARNSQWLKRNGYGFIPSLVNTKFHMGWNEFKKISGFDEEPLQRTGTTLEDLIKEYWKVNAGRAVRINSCYWFQLNGYIWLDLQLRNKFNLSWSDFVNLCDGQYELSEADLLF